MEAEVAVPPRCEERMCFLEKTVRELLARFDAMNTEFRHRAQNDAESMRFQLDNLRQQAFTDISSAKAEVADLMRNTVHKDEFDRQMMSFRQKNETEHTRFQALIDRLGEDCGRKADADNVPTIVDFEGLRNETREKVIELRSQSTSELEMLAATVHRKADQDSVPSNLEFAALKDLHQQHAEKVPTNARFEEAIAGITDSHNDLDVRFKQFTKELNDDIQERNEKVTQKMAHLRGSLDTVLKQTGIMQEESRDLSSHVEKLQRDTDDLSDLMKAAVEDLSKIKQDVSEDMASQRRALEDKMARKADKVEVEDVKLGVEVTKKGIESTRKQVQDASSTMEAKIQQTSEQLVEEISRRTTGLDASVTQRQEALQAEHTAMQAQLRAELTAETAKVQSSLHKNLRAESSKLQEEIRSEASILQNQMRAEASNISKLRADMQAETTSIASELRAQAKAEASTVQKTQQVEISKLHDELRATASNLQNQMRVESANLSKLRADMQAENNTLASELRAKDSDLLGLQKQKEEMETKSDAKATALRKMIDDLALQLQQKADIKTVPSKTQVDKLVKDLAHKADKETVEGFRTTITRALKDHSYQSGPGSRINLHSRATTPGPEDNHPEIECRHEPKDGIPLEHSRRPPPIPAVADEPETVSNLMRRVMPGSRGSDGFEGLEVTSEADTVRSMNSKAAVYNPGSKLRICRSEASTTTPPDPEHERRLALARGEHEGAMTNLREAKARLTSLLAPPDARGKSISARAQSEGVLRLPPLVPKGN